MVVEEVLVVPLLAVVILLLVGLVSDGGACTTTSHLLLRPNTYSLNRSDGDSDRPKKDTDGSLVLVGFVDDDNVGTSASRGNKSIFILVDPPGGIGVDGLEEDGLVVGSVVVEWLLVPLLLFPIRAVFMDEMA